MHNNYVFLLTLKTAVVSGLQVAVRMEPRDFLVSVVNEHLTATWTCASVHLYNVTCDATFMEHMLTGADIIVCPDDGITRLITS